MPPSEKQLRTAYVCKLYPRFSETFILTEILAHQRAGAAVEIFSLRPPLEGRFHELLAEVRSPVTYVEDRFDKAATVWDCLRSASSLPGFVHTLPELLAADPRDALQALSIAEACVQRGVDHLHAHFGSLATTVARLAARTAGIPYTFTAHAKDIFHDSVDDDDLAGKIADAAAVVTVSDFNAAHLRRSYPAGRRIERIYNGLDLARFPYRDPHDRPPHIVSVGRLVEKKGFPDLVDAMALAVADRPELRCTIVGTGELEIDIRRRIAAHGLEPHVTMTGALPQAEVRRIVGSAAVFAAPCIVGADGNRDGLPTVLLEAMALGTPCVSTDVTGIPEVVIDGHTGLMVAQHDAAGLAAALVRLVDERDLRSRLARNARRLIVDRFDSDQQARQLRVVFRSAAERRAAVA